MPGRDYWKKRMEAMEEQSHKKGIEYDEFAQKQFYRAERNIDREIAKWYGKLAENNSISYSSARELLRKDELEEFHWNVEEYIKKGELSNYTDQWNEKLKNASAKVHISRLEAMKLQMQQECEVLYGNLHDALDDKLRDIYTDGYYKSIYEIQKGYGVGSAFNRLDTRRIETAVNSAWAQDGSNFSDRIWKDKDRLVNELNKELTQAVIAGGNYQDVVKKLAKRLNVSESNVKRLVYTEASAIHAKSQQKCYKELGVQEFEFVATLDSRTSEICQAMDGKHFPMAQYEVGVTAPPMHPHCRSCTVPYFEDDIEDSKRAARNDEGDTYLVPADMTYPEWKKTFVDGDVEDYEESDEDFDPKAGNVLVDIGESSTIVSRNISGARNPYGNKAKEHAERYYASVRKMTTDVDRIADASGIDKDKIMEIKNYIFMEKHELGGTEKEYFDPDYMMAESWRRLIDGKPEKHDLTLLNHEIMECGLIQKGMSQQEAHIITAKKYNYDKEAQEFYGKIKKYRKE